MKGSTSIVAVLTLFVISLTNFSNAWADRAMISEAVITSSHENVMEEIPVKVDMTMPHPLKKDTSKEEITKSSSERSTKGIEGIKGVVRVRDRPLNNQILHIFGLMADVGNELRSAVISNTFDAAKRNGRRALSSLTQLIEQASELVNLFPVGDRNFANNIIDQWIGSISSVRAVLNNFLEQDTTLEAVRSSCQFISDEIGQGFWTGAQVALNAYVAFERFSADWTTWRNAIRAYFEA
ncbi:hypothetical protein FGB62_79g037 [Gracilaria domingensis]|nr:hypothetical protein FGB62_79g037 [Gracilaria domingensis]